MSNERERGDRMPPVEWVPGVPVLARAIMSPIQLRCGERGEPTLTIDFSGLPILKAGEFYSFSIEVHGDPGALPKGEPALRIVAMEIVKERDLCGGG